MSGCVIWSPQNEALNLSLVKKLGLSFLGLGRESAFVLVRPAFLTKKIQKSGAHRSLKKRVCFCAQKSTQCGSGCYKDPSPHSLSSTTSNMCSTMKPQGKTHICQQFKLPFVAALLDATVQKALCVQPPFVANALFYTAVCKTQKKQSL